MSERAGILMAMMSSAIGGSAAAFIHFMVASTDPHHPRRPPLRLRLSPAPPRRLLPRAPWPKPRDWPAVAGLGILFFGLCFALFNWALSFTTAARGALAMATLPLVTGFVAVPCPRGLDRRITVMRGDGFPTSRIRQNKAQERSKKKFEIQGI